MNVTIEGITHIGKVREDNQDAIFYFTHPDLPLAYLAVADGMGGYTGGAKASSLAIESIKDTLEKLTLQLPHFHGDQRASEYLDQAVTRAITDANEVILSEKRHCGEQFASMGTTLTVGLFWEDTLVCGHVGDSRLYIYRDHQLNQVTNDHTLVQELVRSGKLKADDAHKSAVKDALTQALGVSTEIEPEVNFCRCHASDIILVCSDGLTKHLSDTEICQELARELPIKRSCHRLIEETLNRGARDNVSILMAHAT
ncbi:protein phosphatase 2C domain-containing protein [Marinobacter sp. chi1]|uniref:Protein phosphatase 2C domain-containing protein n=1 Tax=Marinobacter suaedae TaxID=3057675 RepID=A0ABT8VW08_9GAMM|nr:protein phosphatase 2C domain-containing protein [Marinobacter sp. chi1]MDO3720169.1 protein phosphatase 2C domain-containing protein [Marinobacter sp. chi1]